MSQHSGPSAPLSASELPRIAASMVGACAIGAALLGAVYVATARYQEDARVAGERRSVRELLALDSAAVVTPIEQFLAADHRSVVYRVADAAGGTRELTFDLDGRLRSRRAPAPPAPARDLVPLGRMFVALSEGRPAGFVVEGSTPGYKNRIRFFVAIDDSFELVGVRVVEHEEDPGLGAEVATPWFEGQFIGRRADRAESLAVTRDPMPEDWRAALERLGRVPASTWRREHAGLLERERGRPIYAVSGATISSRAVTEGVRTTLEHFRRRWGLLAPELAAQDGST